MKNLLSLPSKSALSYKQQVTFGGLCDAGQKMYSSSKTCFYYCSANMANRKSWRILFGSRSVHDSLVQDMLYASIDFYAVFSLGKYIYTK
jgi:hypothetical protein